MTTMPLPVLPGHPLEPVPSTEVKNAFGKTLGRVMGGAVIGITRHEEVSAVLLSVEIYRSLLEALLDRHIDPLAELRDRFDRRFAEMQTPKAKAAAQSLFEATPEQLGAAAARGARKRG